MFGSLILAKMQQLAERRFKNNLLLDGNPASAALYGMETSKLPGLSLGTLGIGPADEVPHVGTPVADGVPCTSTCSLTCARKAFVSPLDVEARRNPLRNSPRYSAGTSSPNWRWTVPRSR